MTAEALLQAAVLTLREAADHLPPAHACRARKVAADVVELLVDIDSGPAPTVPAILRAVARKHDLTPARIVGPSRNRRVIRARDELFRQVRDRLHWSYPRIGREFGRDHSTVIVAIRRARARL